MRRVITAGLVGTAQMGSDLPPDDPRTDEMVSSLGLESVERAYLLRAGASAVRQAAGYTPVRIERSVEPCPEEVLPPCGPTVEGIIGLLLSGNRLTLLAEALHLLRGAGRVVSPALVPGVLELRAADARTAALPVLGERGRWLSQFKTDWRWASTQTFDGTTEAPTNLESLWQEGTTDQRTEALRYLRRVSPGTARDWLAATWKREKADTRATLLGTLATGLSLDDESLLEPALDDRAAAVREVARNLLAALPGSAFSGRMRERAEHMLAFTRDAVEAKPPTTLPADWQRDGIGQKAAVGRGERASWLTTILSAIPCAVWSARFDLAPDELIAAVTSSSWRDAVLEGWTRAAAKFHDAEWALALWRRWAATAAKGDYRADRDTLRDLVAPLVPTGELEAYAASYFNAASNPGSASFEEAVAVLPTPWSAAFGLAFLAAFREFVAALDPAATDVAQWDSVLSVAAFALPPACFDAALEPLELPESHQWRIRAFRQQLGDFVDTIRLRQQLYEEISLS